MSKDLLRMKKLQLNWWVIFFLSLGVLFKLFVTSNENIIFHMDSARDYVDIREMVELGKIRLTGPTSGIEGFYTGPGWYYLLAVPYILFDGDPYSGVVTMIVMWAIGGYFLYLLTRKYGFFAWFSSLLIWIGSPYISLATIYSYNPNPVLFMTPLFIYFLERYLEEEKLKWSISAAIVAAWLFQWEMNIGFFIPFVIVAAIVVSRKWNLFKSKSFWLAGAIYGITYLPQVLFDLRHQFIMFNSIMRFLSAGGNEERTRFLERVELTWETFYNSFIPTFLNNSRLVDIFIVGFLVICLVIILRKRQEFLKNPDYGMIVSLLLIVVPFVSYLFIPVKVYSWHMVSGIVAVIVLMAFVIGEIKKVKFVGYILIVLFVFYCLVNVFKSTAEAINNHGKISDDPSNLRNELNAIDLVYQKAGGKDFKAYSYLPSVIDYPYQYLYWWYGIKKYGYTPLEYAYLPDVPKYISNKESFNKPLENNSYQGQVFLIREPDRIGMRAAWEGELIQFKKVSLDTLGPLEIETRQE